MQLQLKQTHQLIAEIGGITTQRETCLTRHPSRSQRSTKKGRTGDAEHQIIRIDRQGHRYHHPRLLSLEKHQQIQQYSSKKLEQFTIKSGRKGTAHDSFPLRQRLQENTQQYQLRTVPQ